MTMNRILEEGYGGAAWYGADMKTAVTGVAAGDVFKRPAKGRHNIAEVALHHAYWADQTDAKLTGKPAAAFPLAGEDWFELNNEKTLSWEAITEALDAAQARLAKTVKSLAGGKGNSPLSEKEQQNLVLGITGHAAYHAGQIQLIKKLIGA